jgi:hypothetical protein
LIGDECYLAMLEAQDLHYSSFKKLADEIREMHLLHLHKKFSYGSLKLRWERFAHVKEAHIKANQTSLKTS